MEYFTEKTRDNGDKFYCLNEGVEKYEELRDTIRDVAFFNGDVSVWHDLIWQICAKLTDIATDSYSDDKEENFEQFEQAVDNYFECNLTGYKDIYSLTGELQDYVTQYAEDQGIEIPYEGDLTKFLQANLYWYVREVAIAIYNVLNERE